MCFSFIGSSREKVVRSAALVAMACTSLMLSACQTPLPGETVVSSDPPAFETGILSSNEANRLGRSDLAAGNYGMAERHFRDAVEKDRNDGPSWIGLAAAYDNLGRFELADNAYQQAIAVQGEGFEIINNIGYSYLLRGDKRRALRQFERALALDPANPVVRNNIGILRSGERPNRAVPL
jgi:Flp pilus assembly protein TadD